MNKQVESELKKIGIIFIIAYLFFQIHYFKESAITILRLVLGHFYLFIIPGYALMLSYLKKISFEYRLFIGLMLGYAIQGVLSFIITLVFHLNLKSYYLITPIMLIILGLWFSKKELK